MRSDAHLTPGLSLISTTHCGQEGARTTGEGFLVDSLQVGLLADAGPRFQAVAAFPIAGRISADS